MAISKPGRPKVMLTGADGFAGRILAEHLQEKQYQLLSAVRKLDPSDKIPGDKRIIGNLNEETDWSQALDGVEIVVHLAARAHILREKAEHLDLYDLVNHRATLNLARQALSHGVRRFIFVSTAGVHGRAGLTRLRPGTEESPLSPQGPYAKSKLEAENGLRRLAAESGLELVIIRPVLMYGPGVKGNLRTLMKWLRRGLPWPLASVDNRRSFLNVRNFADFAVCCLEHPQAAGQTFILADGRDLSTLELLRQTGRALGVGVRSWPCPPGLLRAGANCLGRPELAGQLLDDLSFDISKAKSRLGWRPPFSLEEGLKEMADHFRRNG